MSNFLQEAFQALKLTESETFELDKAGVADLSGFLSTDFQLEDTTVDIIDPEAETEEDLQKSYIGEVILECQACHVPHYCHPEDVVIDEEAGLANIEDVCPNCYSNEGFKIVGTVAPYEDITVEASDDVEVEVDGKEISTEETEKEEVEVDDNLDEAKTAVDKDALKKRFAGRFATNESLSLREKRLASAKKHLTRKNKEEDVEACQKNPVDTEKSIAGELKEAKKRHLTRKEKEETLQKCQKGEVDVTKSQAGELKEAKKRHLTRNEDEEKLLKCQKGKVDTTKSEAGELKEEKASCEGGKCEDKKQLKRRHITKNNDDEALEICQKNPVDTTKSEAGKLREAKKRHLTRNEDEEKLLKCQKGSVDTTKSIAGELKESDASAATSIEDAQKWVDYDMKKYGHISDKTNELVKKAGFQIVKDQYGDYEVIAGKYDESLTEAMEDISITTGDEVIKIKATPRADKETVVPPVELAAEEVDEGAVEEMPDLEDVEIEEVDEESFDNLGESYLKRAYNNVKSFKTQKAMQSKNALVLEGKIEFKSGKVATTRFIFEAANKDKKGNLQFLGLNENLAKKKGAFKLSASIADKKLVCESLNYNYHGKDLKSGKSQRLYGTVKNR